MLQLLFPDMKGKGTYKTREGAVKALEKKLHKIEDSFRYIIVANEEGRFFPVVQLTKDQQYMAGSLAYIGVGVMV